MRAQYSVTAAVSRPHRWAWAFVISIPAVYAAVLALFWNRVGPADYDQFLVFHELQYWNASLFGLAKQWTPVMCSGLSLAGEPQVPFASLTMILTYLFGAQAGLALGSALYFVAGWVGTYLYSGLYVRERLQRALAASLFLGNGFFICRMAYGHVDFLPFLSLPLALWIIHATLQKSTTDPPVIALPAAMAMLGVLIALAIDGSPVGILHWLFWIVLYCGVLAAVARSFRPLALIVGACLAAGVLDAGYLWPMIEAQASFPRLTPDTFTGPWNLLWYLLVPMRGKLFPANGKGLELSVFIGPVLFYLIWRYRKQLVQQLPPTLRIPLLIVSVVSILLGMGSFHAIDAPTGLSLFDALRPLPGFRSIGVTGRFWGFLALPLALLSAAALWRWLLKERQTRRWSMVLALALLLQLIFQTQSLLSQWQWRRYPPIDTSNTFNRGTQAIRAVRMDDTDEARQGEHITPTQQLINCYDMDDFLRADIRPGTALVKEVHAEAAQRMLPTVTAQFLTWNRIRIFGTAASAADRVQITLNQAYHRGWQAIGCDITQGSQNNLVLSCPAVLFADGAVEVSFHDALSATGARVSQIGWGLLGGIGFLALLYAPYRSRERSVAVAADANTSGA